jgi:hypothetical protein
LVQVTLLLLLFCCCCKAHAARELYSDYLKDSGAHAIAVDKITGGGADAFGVIAFYEKQPDSPLPDSLEIEQDGNKKSVPLATMIAPRAKPE